MVLSATNPRIKRLRRLSGRRGSRLEEGAFVIEGPVLVTEAITTGLEIEAVYVDERESQLITHFDALGAGREFEVVTVAAGTLANVLPATAGQPVCAVAPLGLASPLDDVVANAAAAGRPLLVLVDVADPGNAGTLVRVAEASGCGGVLFLGYTVDIYNPKVVRSTAGSVFRVPVAVEPDTDAAFVAIAELGVPLVAGVARYGTPHLAALLDGTVGIVLGNEAHGLPDELVAACDATVTITMDGPAESLNVAMAGTVLCFEAMRRRLELSPPDATTPA